MEPVKLNREQRRYYKRKHAHSKFAHYCPYCKMNTIWTMDEDKKNICCEICANIMFKVPEEDDSNGTVVDETGVSENNNEVTTNEDT